MTYRIVIATVPVPGGSTEYHGSDYYATRPGDTPASTLASARLREVVYERAITYDVWSRSPGGVPIAYLDLTNVDGGLDAWPPLAWKGVRVDLSLIERAAAWSARTAIGSVVVQKAVAQGSGRLRLQARSTLEAMAKAITTVYPDTISNTQLRGAVKPLTIGEVEWVDPRPQRLNAGSTRGLYDVTDAHFEGISEVRHRGSPLTEQQSPALSSGGYFVDSDDCFGFRFGAQSYRLAALVLGNVRRGTQVALSSDFPTGSGGYPANWDVVEGGGGTVVWNSAGNVSITGDGTAETYIAADVNVTYGALYQFELDIISQTGVATLWHGSTAVREFEDCSALTITATFTASVDDIRVGFAAGASGTLQIAAFRCYRVYRIDSLAEVMRFLCARTGVAEADVNLTACAAIDTATPYKVALSTTAEITGEELARRAALSFGCSWFQDRFGQLTPVRLAAPSGTPDLEIAEWQVLGEISVEEDDAAGLSTRMHYGRNYVVHSDDDMSGVTDPDTRARLSREVGIVTTTETLHARYSDAETRDPLDSLLSDQADAQDEIDRLCGLYTVARMFYSFRVRADVSTDPFLLEPGKTIELTHRRHGLSGGKLLRIVLARQVLGSGTSIDLVGWG